ALPYNILGRMYLVSGDAAKGIAYLEKGIPMMERVNNKVEVCHSRGYLAMMYGFTGNFANAAKHLRAAMSLSVEMHDMDREATTIGYDGFIQVFKGDWDRCIASSDRCIALSTAKIGNVMMEALATNMKGYANFMLGDRKSGLELIRKGIQTMESMGSRISLSYFYAVSAEMLCLAGNTDAAEAYARQSLDLGPYGEKWGASVAHRALAMAACQGQQPDWKKAEEHMAESLRLAASRGERPNLAVVHFRFAELLQKKGDEAAAREKLSQATALFREMGMTWWLEQAERLATR
ncbi:MAG: tetratricopeptide repeat protein, partial [SAR324 cluster bacterium]|nr:tetratricopeptide repeat protein [SAR324 cluster bacterium]